MTAREIDPRLGVQLSGLVDGEGCFSIEKHPKGNYHCSFSIRLRADDRPMLERYRDGCGGIGTIREQPRRNAWAPTVTWVVASKAGVGVIRDLFALYPLWSKKSRDFEIWAGAVDFWLHCAGYRTDWTTVAVAKDELHAARRYVPRAGDGWEDAS